jgi:hypothetical protein
MSFKGPHQSPLRGASFSKGEATILPSPMERGDRRAAMVGAVLLAQRWIGMK